jgi:diketogulonate reductase-like aldo/keto reductase
VGLIERTIPGSGERLPVLGLGTFRAFDVSPRSEDVVRLASVVDRFIEGGGRVIDASPMYGEAEAVVELLLCDTDVYRNGDCSTAESADALSVELVECSY